MRELTKRTENGAAPTTKPKLPSVGEESGALSSWFLIVAFLAGSAASVLLCRALTSQEENSIERGLAVSAASVKSRLGSEMMSRVRGLESLATRWAEEGKPSRVEWAFDVWLNFSHHPGYQAIEWVDRLFQVQWVEPRKGNEKAQGINLGWEPRGREALESLRNREEARLTRSIPAVDGRRGLLGCAPIFRRRKFIGFIVGVFHEDDLLATILDANFLPRHGIAVSDGATEIYRRGGANPDLERRWGRETSVEVRGIEWKVRVWPEPEVLAAQHSGLPRVALVGGVAMSFLVALSVHLAQRARSRTRAAVAARRQLEEEILERRRIEAALSESEELFRTMADTAPVMLWIADPDGLRTFFNKPWMDFTGRKQEQELAQGWASSVHPQDVERCLLMYRSAFEVRRSFRIEYRLRSADGRFRWVLDTGVPRFSPTGEFIGYIGSAIDITERRGAEDQIKAALREKDVLLREVHHRVKNNLQIISSLLHLQLAYIHDEQARALYRESQDRIRSMALIHAILYQSKDFTGIDFAAYVHRLTENLFRSHGVDPEIIRLRSDIDDVSLGLDTAIPCGLILNELVSNCLSHAFPDGRKGEIHVELYAEGNKRYRLVVSDNGAGFPKDLDFRNTTTLGLQLVITLTDQLAGTIDLVSDGITTTFLLKFAEVEYKERGVALRAS